MAEILYSHVERDMLIGGTHVIEEFSNVVYLALYNDPSRVLCKSGKTGERVEFQER